MYQVRVAKPGHEFVIIDIDCANCADKMADRWEELGYESVVEDLGDK